MNNLVALPVNGDAFLLQRAGRTVLVDGGTTSARLAAELANFYVDDLDIVVCTHADADHAGGLVDILDTSNVTVREFWLPGEWLHSLPVLLPHPEQAMERLVEEAESFRGDVSRDLDNHGDFMPEPVYEQTGHEREYWRAYKYSESPDEDNDGLGWLKEWAAAAEVKQGAAAARVFRNAENRIRYRARRGKITYQVASAWIAMIKTADRIRKIALQAIRHNVCVRWFDFSEFKKKGYCAGGEPDLLIPLNAVELRMPPVPTNSAFYLYLTAYNRECLVFLSPSYDGLFPYSIVFTGDSPLGTGRNYATSWLVWPRHVSTEVIATAPHHGSESNAHAYGHLTRVANVLMWLRSGGGASHPGATYRRIPPWIRYCTHCPRLNQSRQAIVVDMNCPLMARAHGRQCVC
ncbi:MBL fold metallo-hydrolase [Pseudomonas sp. MAFF 730085]|uniref:MBL fold metallo-hydrolase n=1 Tax=Pseudomonas kitaguniensis TaxID=2607908 RepID=A0A5N7JRX1_9PSED|nr:MBL fold metallo-hydrolase [Pseudomonas kitaguniensis]MPQ84130.1 MBL fold metallo-hydrolase [Pseudomonas kitaguniensis]